VSAALVVAAIARADFRERVRRYAFLVTLGSTLAAAYGFMPPNHSRYATLQFDGHRGIYNSAWVGNQVALLTTIFLSLAGFYLVKNAVDHDRRSGVGAILAATPISKGHYVLGKVLSNLAVLSALVGVLAVGAAAMQLVRGEDLRLVPADLVLPFVLNALPALAVVAAVAVLFEVTPVLRGGLGNVAYFFLWSFLGVAAAQSRHGGADFLGAGVVLPSMAAACKRAYTDYDLERMPLSMGLNFRQSGTWDLGLFTWNGPEWGLGHVLSRIGWVGLALGVTGVATLLFDRFDADVTRRRGSTRARRRPGAAVALEDSLAPGASPVRPGATGDVHLTPLVTARGFPLLPLVMAELRLMLRGLPLAWWLVAAGLMLASLLAPLPVARHGLLAALWIWPLLLWSALGNREQRHGTAAMVFSSPRPVVRPLLAQWIAGAALAVGLGAVVAARLAAGGDAAGAAAVIAGALFVPALAVGLGAWSGSSKLFEIVYLLIWYMGPVNRVPGLDFSSSGGGAPMGWLVATAACLAAAIAARAWRPAS
jgi:hypothetical protein